MAVFIGTILATLEAVSAGVAALLVPVAAILFVFGRGGAAGRALMWAVILAFVSVGGYAVTRWVVGGVGGGVHGVNNYFVTEPPGFASKYFPVEISVIPLYSGRARYYVVVEWGDGAVSRAGAVSPEPVTLSHSYYVVGNYTVRVMVYECWEGCGLVRSYVYHIRVSAPWVEIGRTINDLGSSISGTNAGFWSPLYWVAGKLVQVMGEIFVRVTDITSRFMAEHGVYAGYAFYYYITMPSSGNYPALASVYGAVRTWALLLLPVALVINVLWRAYWEFERGFALLDVVREFVFVLFILFFGLSIYDAAADIVNTMCLSLAQLGQLSSLYSMLLGFVALTSALGVFSPLAANMAALTASALVFLVIGGVLKWLLAAALAVVIPVLAVVWLIPPLRGLASTLASLLAGLFMFSIVSAAFSRLAGELGASLGLAGGAGNLVFAVVMPVVYLVLGPMILQYIGGHLGGLFLPSIRYMLRAGLGGLAGLPGGPSVSAGAPGAPAASVGAAAATAVALAPVVGTTTLRNPLASQLMRQRIAAAPLAKPLIQEARHPRLSMAYHVARSAITGQPPEWELSRREKLAYHALKHTLGRQFRALRQAANTFRQTLYHETGIWIPGRLPREEEIRLAAKGAKKTYEIMRGSIKLIRTKIMGRLEDIRPLKIEDWS